MDPATGADMPDDRAAQREIELKLFVPPSSVGRIWLHPLLAEHAIGPRRVARLESRYFDTPKRELAAHRMALRLRGSGRRWVQTLKSGGEGGAISTRGEWETALAGPAFAWVALRESPLAALGSARSLARRLQPVFVTDFRRESRMLRLADGSTVEFAFDRGVVAAGRGKARRTLPICEVEIELKERGGDGAEDAVMRFAARLARDIALVPLFESKAARGYRLADGVTTEAAKAVLPRPEGGDDARHHLARVLDACNAALLANTHALFERSGPVSPLESSFDFVHQARVAIRRARSALRTFRPVARGRRLTSLDDALRSIAHAFGDARDWDVLATTSIERLDEEVGCDAGGKAAVREVRTAIDARRRDAHHALMRALDEPSFGATAIALQRIATRLRDGSPTTTLDACTARWMAKQQTRVVDRARRIAVLDPEARHGLRIEVKRLRYALDLLQPLYDDDAVGAFHDALAELQTRLGKLNDQVIAQQLLRSLEPGPSLELVLGRHAAWLERHVVKQLPKIAALSVAFELTPAPWAIERPRAFG